MRMKIAWMLAGGMRCIARFCSSVVIQSSPPSFVAGWVCSSDTS